ncbi:unnamed protein product [Adineta steineri]|uniref:BZIP domain-containing protein n=1 Tax=Adineta steineri TaxID=433720 RepID=A0A818V7Y6_9BILA|nr:unnamed protein product [Adineta steineri]CAF3711272.1 unnamed protein product [Adineta steineri]
MVKNDISYLYSDDYLTSSLSNENNSSLMVTEDCKYEPIEKQSYQKTNLSSHRSKHILILSSENFKREKRRDKTRMTIRRLNENQNLLQEMLYKKDQELNVKESRLEAQLFQLQSYKNNLENIVNNNLYVNSINKALLKNSDDYGLSNMSITEVFNLNNGTNS